MGVKIIFLPDCPLVLSLLKHRDIGTFLNIKMRNPNRENPLNNSIDKSMSLLEVGRHFNVKVKIYYFYQFTILTPFLSFR